MEMLWKHYVLRRGPEAFCMWGSLFSGRPVRLLYIAGAGFDPRAGAVMKAFIGSLRDARTEVREATFLRVGLGGYELSSELSSQTAVNSRELGATFDQIGATIDVGIRPGLGGHAGATAALREGVRLVTGEIAGCTDVVLDASSLPRIVYLALLTGILDRLIGNLRAPRPLLAGGVNFQVLVAEDAALDASIISEDPSNDLIFIPGFSAVLQAESCRDWPMVWFPILGEGKYGQLDKVAALAIPSTAEVCPVLPHPSRNPRRADRLLVDYRQPLIEKLRTPTENVLLAHESNPFEAYRQLRATMVRYRDTMRIMGEGCRLVVTPLASKLITIGSGLACFEMRPREANPDYGVAIAYAETTRYSAAIERLRSSSPEISAMLLTGEAYGTEVRPQE